MFWRFEVNKSVLFVLGFSCVLATSAIAQDSQQNLAQELANPIASLISVPIQVNYDRGIGPANDGKRITANIQPVVPIELNPNWTLISRTIIPVIHQEDIFPSTPGFDQTSVNAGTFELNIDESDVIPGAGTQFGVGDIAQSFFFSPKPVPLPGGASLIFGAGPVLLLPTGTDDLLTTDKWGAGPTGVALVQSGPWTVGTLVNHVWSFAGDSKRDDISASFIQPFISYTTPNAFTFSLNTESTYDWENSEWSVPVNFVVSKLTTIGRQPVSFAIGTRYWAESTPGGPEGWGARFATTFLFPKK